MSVKQNILLWGSSGTGKTSLLGTMALWHHRRTGKRTRLYSADGGGWATIQHLVDARIVEAWDVARHLYPFETSKDVTQGGWPSDPADPLSPLIPAWEVRHKAECGKCNKVMYDELKAPPVATLTCPACRVPVTPKMVRRMNPANGLLNVGFVAYEGLTAFGEWMMDDMATRSAKGEKIGGDIAVRFQDNNELVGSNTQSSYGIAQRRVKGLVQEARHLPVDYVAWTALKNRGTDDDRRVPVFGPKLPGNAATDDAPRWFGPSLGTIRWPLPAGKPEHRLYLKGYFETFNTVTKDIENLCNSRIPPVALEGVPDFVVYKPEDEECLGKVIQLIEERQAYAGEMMAKKTAPVPTPAPVATVGAKV